MGIVVTGASGFVAGTLVPVLVNAGHDVVAIDRAAPTVFAPTVTHLTCELSTPSDAVVTALREADAVIHVAGCPGVRDAAPMVAQRRHRDNVAAAQAVAAATPLTTPTIVLSSSSVYGGARARSSAGLFEERIIASHEDDRLCARGGYAASKIATEQVCRQRADAGGHVLVVRPFTVLGEGQRSDMAVARWAREARETGAVTVLGDPARTRDFTDVRDVARALAALLDRGPTGTVNLGTGRGQTLAALATAVSNAVGATPALRVVPAGEAEVAHTRAHTQRLRSLVGFVPHTDLVDVVARSVAGPRTSVDAAGNRDVVSDRVGYDRVWGDGGGDRVRDDHVIDDRAINDRVVDGRVRVGA